MPSPAQAARKLLGAVIGLTAVVVVMLCAFALPSVKGGPHHMPLGLTGPAAGHPNPARRLERRGLGRHFLP